MVFFSIPLKFHKGTHNVQWNEQRSKVNSRIWRASDEWRKGDSHLATPNKCKLIHFYSVAGGWSKSSLYCYRLNANDALVESDGVRIVIFPSCQLFCRNKTTAKRLCFGPVFRASLHHRGWGGSPAESKGQAQSI